MGAIRPPQPGAGLIAHGAVFLETIDSPGRHRPEGPAPPSSMLGCVVAGEGVKRRVEEQLELWDRRAALGVSAREACGVTNGYDHPNRLGVDRWVAMIGAWHRVLALGRAAGAGGDGGQRRSRSTRSMPGRFLGGLILPGFGLMLRAPRDGHGRVEGAHRRGGGPSDQHQ